MSAITVEGCNARSQDRDSHPASGSSRVLFVSPHDRRKGFRASIRGHILDLADPNTGYELAPTPDDLFILSIASELAWTAQRILRAGGLPDDVSVSANWRKTADPPRLADIDLMVNVSRHAKATSAALAAAFQSSLAARSLAEPSAHISWEGANR